MTQNLKRFFSYRKVTLTPQPWPWAPGGEDVVSWGGSAIEAHVYERLGGQSLPPRAEPSSDAARAALVEAIAAGARVPGPALRAPLPNLKQALRFLRALKGPRSVEFSLCAQLEGVAGKPGEVYVFSASERAFARGYAVLANGEVIAFGGQK